jgi:hypothetical protein
VRVIWFRVTTGYLSVFQSLSLSLSLCVFINLSICPTPRAFQRCAHSFLFCGKYLLCTVVVAVLKQTDRQTDRQTDTLVHTVLFCESRERDVSRVWVGVALFFAATTAQTDYCWMWGFVLLCVSGFAALEGLSSYLFVSVFLFCFVLFL